tara:strand:+ start:6047 stop:7951 length:1905 start_codon:yes stop_codon:yes gene_type:complete
MPVKPYSDFELSNTALKTKRYPNPFFDLAQNYLPKNIKTLFRYCRNFFYTNGFIRNVVTKLTEYPITELQYSSNVDPKIRKKFKVAFDQKIKLKSLLIEIGLDYFTYGNCFISASMKPKRYVVFPDGQRKPLEAVQYKLKNFKVHATDPKTKASVPCELEDDYVKTIDNLKFVRWAPENIDIEYNPITGRATYYYSIPAAIKKKIIAGNKDVMMDIPLVFLDSLSKKKRIKLDPSNLFHFKRPSLAEDDMGWGKPILLPALKEIYYLQTLKRGNEAIANEHIIPKKAIYPANTTTLDPYTQMNLGKWKGQMESQIKKWKVDPNHIGVFPIPIGYQELGGNARGLMLTPEMKFLEETIINSLGVPLEFIKGGSTFTSGSVSLRIVENHFITYRELLQDFVNHFMVHKLCNLLNYPSVEVKFKTFKMADDSQTKQLAINLNQMGKISDERLLNEFGYNHTEEKAAIRHDQIDNLEQQVESSKKSATAQGEAQLIATKYQVRAEQAAADERARLQIEAFQDELSAENVGVPEDHHKIIDRYAQQIYNMPPDQQQITFQKMQQNMPVTFGFVNRKVQEMWQQDAIEKQQQEVAAAEAAQKQVAEEARSAPNQKEVGERKQDQVEISGEKKKGPTKGNV